MSFVMSEFGTGSPDLVYSAGLGESAEGAEGTMPRLHPKSFKLRFATQHELGRSNVSAVKPFGLPSVVRGKEERFASEGASAEAVDCALRRVQAMFREGPREQHTAPRISSHEYGWWWERGAQIEEASQRDPRLRHHIRDSAWLKERIRVLPSDNGIKRR